MGNCRLSEACMQAECIGGGFDDVAEHAINFGSSS